MATTTAQSHSETANNTVKKSRSVKRKAKAGRPVGSRNRNRDSESMTSQMLRQTKDAVSGVYETAAKAGRAMPKMPKMPRMPSTRELRNSGQSVYAMMEERPLVLGVVGLGVGIALAALLPNMKHSGNRR
jgi:hypothetical protein